MPKRLGRRRAGGHPLRRAGIQAMAGLRCSRLRGVRRGGKWGGRIFWLVLRCCVVSRSLSFLRLGSPEASVVRWATADFSARSEKYFQERSAEPQVPPLRFAPGRDDKERVTVPQGVVAGPRRFSLLWADRRPVTPAFLMTTDRVARRVPWYPTSREKRARCPEFPARDSRQACVCAFLLRKGA
jgi:hypothetical protein